MSILTFRKVLLAISILGACLALATKPAYAVTIPSFPQCSNPSGTLRVSYGSGTHGIVGSGATYTGSDSVYTVSSDALVQCFCPDTAGSGVQTNWWKTSGLSDEDIQVLKNEGWNYIPNGTLWGLENTSYLAKNSEYSCKANVGGVSATNENVQGLAAMGDSILIYAFGGAGMLLLLLGFLLKRASR